MNYFLALLAGAVQGLTEFLPISSTGHLIIFEKIFNISQIEFGLAFDASLHLGTLLAIAIFFFRDYLKVFSLKNQLFIKLIIGTIPAAIAGLFLETAIESQFRQLWVVGLGLILFSLVIILAEKFGPMVKKEKDVTLTNSLIIGLFQSLALIPGVSRSGSTISGGLFLGLKRDEAARFAFLLSGPIIAGAGAKKFLDVATSSISLNDLSFFIIGIISSAIFGYLTIKYFLKYLSTSTLYPFVIYRVIVGLLLLSTYLV
ncbi:MAG: Undecaprenyl-diphosphatase [Candidatus Curtissbacteria bacterium GW2011_GWA1_40_47]|uniref:Undecaprenyl-diphosphatase n=1 Tax=Candidatus Curtissbacteria bacterium RIFOXYA1_FULL_41_14 TaxID=1797737 RepID=A0A1F5HBV2_9BACT|nr:MAG: Undecaprenyl-diphosphatase [Candidatus Curtissbacteria bacterium GW2011_GWB1_40_28]KKR59890.1 MAG: Undecaprenyl-diphosphatase [Candidatus Curtissbacteria bacterium GW2011_GWA2_40_31]KKR61435.1 MAG: Undecaprenyl-diphosphatase [Microgenomates group bacterium GW2011_GWC1_40_35]KKR64983.1 MAG: Undecaprenyl-diphosphatase [Candidatus Curtissbacteria bacterium GW2011_GWA1_40_47]KKS01097.1 MAG: Undecaprenyl-diphosphatase [Candidatus Curtissbacteria bacterium GW2011_GWC2_41_21]OGD78398.1 MAG: u